MNWFRCFNSGDSVKFPGKEGDIIYSKNNVCVHPAVVNDVEPAHVPGYLTLHCQKDEVSQTNIGHTTLNETCIFTERQFKI